jgi:hypothetical protein
MICTYRPAFRVHCVFIPPVLHKRGSDSPRKGNVVVESISEPFLKEKPREEGQFQHALPRLILRRFSINNDKKNIYTFNLLSRTVTSEYIDKVGGNYNIYDIELPKSHLTAEDSLASYESIAGEVIVRILKNDSIELGERNKLKLSEFYCIQYARTEKWTNKMAREMAGGIELEKHRVMRTIRPGLVITNIINTNEQNTARVALIEEIRKLANLLSNKKWILLKTDDSHPFLLGDNPVVPWNHTKREVESYDLSDEAVSFYIPLTPLRALMMINEKHWQDISQSSDLIKKNEINRGYRNLSSEEVESFNYMQINRAERIVFSNTPNFTTLQTREDLQGRLRENDFYMSKRNLNETMKILRPHLIKTHLFMYFYTNNKWSFPHANNLGQYSSMWDVSEDILSKVRIKH